MRFAEFVRRSRDLVVQPRMGFGNPVKMRAGLMAVGQARANTVGTITLDSYTRVGDLDSVERALHDGVDLNGFPIVSYGPDVTRAVLHGVEVPVQIRHGSPLPDTIFDALVESGLDATEGGPVSYCLPYSRVPLRDAVRSWARCSERFATLGPDAHLESFGGCMLGQLCPPSVLIALSVLEGMFFRQHGVRSVSLSYAQQTNPVQDELALAALRSLAAEFLSDVDRHIVLYTYMGVYPRSRQGALGLLADAARLAIRGGAARLIVKTSAEAYRIPTIEENVEALELAGDAAAMTSPAALFGADSEIHAEARTLIDAVLNLGSDLGTGLTEAFAKGYLDVPYCLHEDNRNAARSYLDDAGWLRWANTGAMPISGRSGRDRVTSGDLLNALYYVSQRYDRPAIEEGTRRVLDDRQPVARL
jgi:methylaspartate mutase epsilon subunit